jgi:tetratricopeptide (TPR) repeat protein
MLYSAAALSLARSLVLSGSLLQAVCGQNGADERLKAGEALAQHLLAQSYFGVRDFASGVLHELRTARLYREAGESCVQNQLAAWGEAAGMQQRLGDFAGAAVSHRAAASLVSRWQAPVRVNEMNIWCRAAWFLVISGQRSEAASLYRQAIERAEKGNTPELSWIALQGMAASLLSVHRFAEAGELLRRALNLAQQLSSTTPLDVASLRLSLARALTDLGETDTAEGEFSTALPVLKEAQAPAYGAGLHWLGLLRTRQGRFVEAETAFRQARTFLLRWSVPADPSVLAVQADHIAMLRKAGRKREASAISREFEQNLTTWRSHNRADHTIDVRSVCW